jgi:hypothetical protein
MYVCMYIYIYIYILHTQDWKSCVRTFVTWGEGEIYNTYITYTRLEIMYTYLIAAGGKGDALPSQLIKSHNLVPLYVCMYVNVCIFT